MAGDMHHMTGLIEQETPQITIGSAKGNAVHTLAIQPLQRDFNMVATDSTHIGDGMVRQCQQRLYMPCSIRPGLFQRII